MRTLEDEKDKIQKICDQLRKETLEPAEKEAGNIVEEAKRRAKEIVEEANRKGEEAYKRAMGEIEQQRALFHSSLTQAGRQGLEQLRQEIEHKLFKPELEKQVASSTKDPKIISKLIQAIVDSINEHGHEADLAIYIPAKVSPKEVAEALAKEVVQNLAKEPFELGDFQGGAKIQLKGKKMTIDMSDATLTEWIARYIQKDLRKYLFQ